MLPSHVTSLPLLPLLPLRARTLFSSFLLAPMAVFAAADLQVEGMGA